MTFRGCYMLPGKVIRKVNAKSSRTRLLWLFIWLYWLKMTVSLFLPFFKNTSLLSGLELKMCDVWLNTPHLPSELINICERSSWCLDLLFGWDPRCFQLFSVKKKRGSESHIHRHTRAEEMTSLVHPVKSALTNIPVIQHLIIHLLLRSSMIFFFFFLLSH